MNTLKIVFWFYLWNNRTFQSKYFLVPRLNEISNITCHSIHSMMQSSAKFAYYFPAITSQFKSLEFNDYCWLQKYRFHYDLIGNVERRSGKLPMVYKVFDINGCRHQHVEYFFFLHNSTRGSCPPCDDF